MQNEPSTAPPAWVSRGVAPTTYGKIMSMDFDTEMELLWCADSYGYLYGAVPQQPTKEQIAWHGYSTIRPFAGHGNASHCVRSGLGVVFASSSVEGFVVQKRGGARVATLSRPTGHIAPLPNLDAVAVTTEQPGIHIANIETLEDTTALTESMPTTALTVAGERIVSGNIVGEVVVRDTRTTALDVVTTLRQHFGSRIAAVSCREDIVLAAAGPDMRQISTVKIFDLRNPSQPLRSCSISGSVTAAQLYSTREQALQVFTLTPSSFHIWDCAADDAIVASAPVESPTQCSALTLSRHERSAAIGTDKGFVFAFADPLCGSNFSNTDEMVQPKQPQTFTPPKWCENVEDLMSLGFAPEENKEAKLASDWPEPNYMILGVEGKPHTVNPHVKDLAKTPVANAFGIRRASTFAPNAKDKVAHFLPNPYPFNSVLGDDPSTVAQSLLTIRKLKKSRSSRTGQGYYSKLDDALQICYPTLNQQGPDWKVLNPSKDLIGLDNSLPESWMNALIQMLYNLGPPHFTVRRAVMKHFDKQRFSLTSELGSLFHNMQVQATSNMHMPIMQPTNFYRTIRQIPEVAQSGVLEPATSRDDAVAKCHAMVKIMLQLIHDDLAEAQQSPVNRDARVNRDFDMDVVFGTQLQLQSSKNTVPPRFYWEVPASASKVDEGLQHLLRQLERSRGEAVNIRSLPKVLVLLLNPEHGHLRPPSSLKFSRPNEEFNYILASNVVHLADDQDDPGNFVCHAKFPDPTMQTKGDAWVAFNDYCVSPPMSAEEQLEATIPTAMTHSTVVTCYILDEYRRDRPPEEPKAAASEQVGQLLLKDWAADDLLSLRPENCPPTRASLASPIGSVRDVGQTDVIAIDAEYVVPKWGNEPKDDEPEWVRRQRKPFMTLARVSCLLSQYAGHEQTIIDDYIAAPEEIADYVTQYSGIWENDLDVEKSPHKLTTLKANVLKLRCLVDRGVRFVGHGLAQDFRVIGIAVPRHCIIDTLELYHMPGQRYLSLKFLAYHLLKESVQLDCHDSIEDARTALRLFRHFEEITRRNELEQVMNHLYDVGAETNYYVPDPTPQYPPEEAFDEEDEYDEYNAASDLNGTFDAGNGTVDSVTPYTDAALTGVDAAPPMEVLQSDPVDLMAATPPVEHVDPSDPLAGGSSAMIDTADAVCDVVGSDMNGSASMSPSAVATTARPSPQALLAMPAIASASATANSALPTAASDPSLTGMGGPQMSEVSEGVRSLCTPMFRTETVAPDLSDNGEE